MDTKEVERLRQRAENANRKIAESKVKIKMLKEQFQKKIEELEELGITGLKSAKEDLLKELDERIQKSDEECETLARKLEKAIVNAEKQLGNSDEIF